MACFYLDIGEFPLGAIFSLTYNMPLFPFVEVVLVACIASPKLPMSYTIQIIPPICLHIALMTLETVFLVMKQPLLMEGSILYVNKKN